MAAAPVPIGSTHAQPQPIGRGRRFVIAADDASGLPGLLGELLRTGGATEIVHVTRWPDLVLTMEQSRPEWLIVDGPLIDTSAQAAIRRLKDRDLLPPPHRVLVLSVVRNAEMMDTLRGLGIRYLDKPLCLRSLAAALTPQD